MDKRLGKTPVIIEPRDPFLFPPHLVPYDPAIHDIQPQPISYYLRLIFDAMDILVDPNFTIWVISNIVFIIFTLGFFVYSIGCDLFRFLVWPNLAYTGGAIFFCSWFYIGLPSYRESVALIFLCLKLTLKWGGICYFIIYLNHVIILASLWSINVINCYYF